MSQEKNWAGKIINDSEATSFVETDIAEKLNNPDFLNFLSRNTASEAIDVNADEGKEKMSKVFEMFTQHKDAVKNITSVLTEDINLIYQTNIGVSAFDGVSSHLESMIFDDPQKFITLATLTETYQKKKQDVITTEDGLKKAMVAAKIDPGNITNENAATAGARSQNITEALNNKQNELVQAEGVSNYKGNIWLGVKKLVGGGKDEKTLREQGIEKVTAEKAKVEAAEGLSGALETNRLGFLEARNVLRKVIKEIEPIKQAIQVEVATAITESFEGTSPAKTTVERFVRGQGGLETTQNVDTDLFNVNEVIQYNINDINEKAKELVEKCVTEIIDKNENSKNLEALEKALRPILQAEKVGTTNAKAIVVEKLREKAKTLTQELDSAPSSTPEEKQAIAVIRKKLIVLSFIGKEYVKSI